MDGDLRVVNTVPVPTVTLSSPETKYNNWLTHVSENRSDFGIDRYTSVDPRLWFLMSSVALPPAGTRPRKYSHACAPVA